MKRLLIIVGVLLVTLGVCAPIAQAQDMPSQDVTYETDVYSDYGGLSFSFMVIDAGTPEAAEQVFLAVTENAADTIEEQVATEGEVIHVATTIVPNVGDGARGYVAFIKTDKGIVFEYGVIFVQDGQYVYVMVDVGVHGAYLDLCDLTMYYFMVYDREDGDLPPLELMPDGFQEVHGGASI